QQIGEHARRLSSIAESNAAATEELAASASELAGIAEAASAEVGRFRLLVHATAENGAPDRSVAQG
ncbi:hypothetical protein, partial [Symbiobacterium thermophilum]